MNLLKRCWSAIRAPRCSLGFFGVAHRTPRLLAVTRGKMWAKLHCNYCGEDFIWDHTTLMMNNIELWLQIQGITWQPIHQQAPETS